VGYGHVHASLCNRFRQVLHRGLKLETANKARSLNKSPEDLIGKSSGFLVLKG
jgi:hypothetical protein